LTYSSTFFTDAVLQARPMLRRRI